LGAIEKHDPGVTTDVPGFSAMQGMNFDVLVSTSVTVLGGSVEQTAYTGRAREIGTWEAM